MGWNGSEYSNLQLCHKYCKVYQNYNTNLLSYKRSKMGIRIITVNQIVVVHSAGNNAIVDLFNSTQ